MKINDKGFYLSSKAYGENLKILYIFSFEHGLVKGISRFSKNKKFSLVNLDRVIFSWSSRDKDGLGYLNVELDDYSFDSNQDYVSTLIKASASELCLKCLPSWQKNSEIFYSLELLSSFLKEKYNFILKEYILWEFSFLKFIGYGLNFEKCSVTGSTEDIFFVSPKTGNSVCYSIGKKYEKKLFKIPSFIKDKSKEVSTEDYIMALNISSFFFEKFYEKDFRKMIFRNQLINKIKTFNL